MKIKQGRNSLCSCGSGKKYKNCCLVKIPRETYIQFQVKKSVSIDEIGYNFKDNQIMFRSNGKPIPLLNPRTEIGYKRKNKKSRKTTLSISANEYHPSLNPLNFLLEYDYIFAVDTNTKIINIQGKDTNVSVTYISQGLIKKEDDKIITESVDIAANEFHNYKYDPEKVGWKFACKIIANKLNLTSEKKVCLIVDSSLGDLSNFNNKKPILGDWVLPENFTLVYASAESKDTAANMLLKRCDRKSNEILEEIKRKNSNDFLIPANDDDFYTHTRNWILVI